MGYCKQTTLPLSEPVTLAQAKRFMRLPDTFTGDDSDILGFIQAAREKGEIITGRALAQRTFVQVLDSFPYYTDTIQAQSYPPSYYSLPRYSTTLWNYSQMIKLGMSPVVSIQSMQYVNTAGLLTTLNQDVDFVLDRIAEPSRIFPIPGSYWPPTIYVANSLQILFTAGYDADPTHIDTHAVLASPPWQQPTNTVVTGIPQSLVLAVLNLVAYWFNNRGSAESVAVIPERINQMFLNHAIIDWSPTIG